MGGSPGTLRAPRARARAAAGHPLRRRGLSGEPGHRQAVAGCHAASATGCRGAPRVPARGTVAARGRALPLPGSGCQPACTRFGRPGRRLPRGARPGHPRHLTGVGRAAHGGRPCQPFVHVGRAYPCRLSRAARLRVPAKWAGHYRAHGAEYPLRMGSRQPAVRIVRSVPSEDGGHQTGHDGCGSLRSRPRTRCRAHGEHALARIR